MPPAHLKQLYGTLLFSPGSLQTAATTLATYKRIGLLYVVCVGEHHILRNGQVGGTLQNGHKLSRDLVERGLLCVYTRSVPEICQHSTVASHSF